MTLGQAAHSLLLDKIMSRLDDIVLAALDMEIAIVKIQIALHGVTDIDRIKEELERSLLLAKSLKK